MVFPKWNWRRVIFIGVVSLIAGAAFYLFQADSLTKVRHSYDAIQSGMPQQEVEKLLGKPCDLRTDKRRWVFMRKKLFLDTGEDGLRSEYWMYDGIVIQIDYFVSSTSSTVAEKWWIELADNGPTVIERVCDWVKKTGLW